MKGYHELIFKTPFLIERWGFVFGDILLVSAKLAKL
jgi:hypothetical protein